MYVHTYVYMHLLHVKLFDYVYECCMHAYIYTHVYTYLLTLYLKLSYSAAFVSAVCMRTHIHMFMLTLTLYLNIADEVIEELKIQNKQLRKQVSTLKQE